MADINVKSLNIEHGESQLANDPFDVTVVVNNREAVAGFGNKNACTIGSGNNQVQGHRAEVGVEIIDEMGEVIKSRDRRVCAPIDFSSMVNSRDPEETFTFSLPRGSYVVRAQTKGIPDGQSHSVSRSIVVQEEADAPAADDGGNDPSGNDTGNWNPWGNQNGDGNGGGDGNPLTPDLTTKQKAALAAGGLLVAALVFRPYASLGAGVT